MEHLIVTLAAFLEAHVVLKKVGGLWHWRIGRLGGSFYWKKAKASRFQRPTLAARFNAWKDQVLPATKPVEAAPLVGPSLDRINMAMRR